MKHSLQEAMVAQAAFESTFGRLPGILGIGIGMNASRDDLAINVALAKAGAAARLPASFAGLDVVCDVVGEVRAF